MTIHVQQHIPTFVSGVDSAEANVANRDELFAVPFLKRWSDGADFARWSVSGQHLMAEMKDGKFWVAAFLTGDLPSLGLPAWVNPRAPKELYPESEWTQVDLS